MSRGATARLFAAVDPPPESAERLAAWARRAAARGRDRTLRVLSAESLHVTLMFLGERPMEEIGALADAIATAAARARPCEIETAAPVWLPPRRPRALAIELREHSGALGDLRRDVAGLLCAVSGLPEPPRFRPHVTVARALRGVLPSAATGDSATQLRRGGADPLPLAVGSGGRSLRGTRRLGALGRRMSHTLDGADEPRAQASGSVASSPGPASQV